MDLEKICTLLPKLLTQCFVHEAELAFCIRIDLTLWRRRNQCSASHDPWGIALLLGTATSAITWGTTMKFNLSLAQPFLYNSGFVPVTLAVSGFRFVFASLVRQEENPLSQVLTRCVLPALWPHGHHTPEISGS
ncbi:hypothetical protein D9757_013362 [Collybiopsis confluens]|uniref:Uncharacterized protein n=1 Tax=Collybiopsis confluens TaxID=2823264 RepID=A0A8H5FSM0_9AGAR|nr:hypothetical protein D9757_013362 [Collybiopsis confluens]